MTENINKISQTISGTERISQQVLGAAKLLDNQAQKLGEDVSAYLHNILSV